MAIKLPTPLQGAPINVPSTAGVVSGLQREQQQMQQIAGAVAGEVTRFVEERNDEQQNAAFAKANNMMHDFDKEHATREYYSGDEIPEGVDIKTTETQIDADGNEIEVIRDRIPAYEVQAQMRNAHQMAAINAAAADIASPSRRTQFTRQMTERAQAQNIRMLEQQTKAQGDQIRAEQSFGFKQALLDRDYESAAYIANNFNGTDTQRAEMSRQVRYFAESDTYNDVMSEENVQGIDRSIAKLEEDGYSGELNEVQRLATLNQLRSKRSQIGKKQQGKINGQMTLLGVEMDRTIDAMEDGKNIPPEQMSRLTTKVQAGIDAGFIDPTSDTWIKRVAFFQEASMYSNELVDFKSSTLQEQEQHLRTMESEAATGSEHHKIGVFKKNHEYAKTKLRNDPIAYAAEVGVVDVEPFDFANPAESYKKRESAAAAVADTFGMQKSSMFFTQQEVTDFRLAMDQGSVTDQMRQLSIMQSAISGDNANAVRSQLIGENQGAYAVASDALADNKPQIARTVLEGKKALKNVPEVVTNWKVDATPIVTDTLGNAYGSDTKTMGQIMEAAKAHYAAVSVQEGDMSGIIDPSRLEDSIQAVTGGVFEYGGSTMVSPSRELTGDSFDSWIRDMSPEFIGSLGGAAGYDGNQGTQLLKARIRSGSLKLQTIGKGQYALYDNDKSAWVARSDDKGVPFVLEYNPNASIGSKF